MGLNGVRGYVAQQNCVGGNQAIPQQIHRTSALRRANCDLGLQTTSTHICKHRITRCKAIVDTERDIQDLESAFNGSSATATLFRRNRPAPLWNASISAPTSLNSELAQHSLHESLLSSDPALGTLYNLRSPTPQFPSQTQTKERRKSNPEEARKRRKLQRIKYYENISKVWLGDQYRKLRSARDVPVPDPATLQLEDAHELLQHYVRAVEHDQLQHALDIVKRIVALRDEGAIQGITQNIFFRRAAALKDVASAVSFLEALPRPVVSAKTFNLMLTVCAKAEDVRAALGVADLAQQQGIKLDPIHYTNLINACGSAGNVERAIKVYNELKQNSKTPLDMHVYASLISTFTRSIELQPPSNRKQQLVYLERAFDVLEDVLARGSSPSPVVWNALVSCAAACGQVERAFQVVDMMQSASCKPTVETYGALMDVCIITRQQRLALQLFKKALKEGLLHSVQLYTQALRACMLGSHVKEQELSTALDIYRIMKRNKVEADGVLYGHLIALAGKANRPDIALNMLRDSIRREVPPSDAICSGLISAFLRTANHYAATLVYRLLRKQGVYPSLQQYNNLLAAYSKERRLGEVVSLVRDMVELAKLTPNNSTFGVLLDACEKTDQAELAFEILTVMKARGMDIGEVHFSHISKICFNRIRFQWYPPRAPPGAPVFGPTTPTTNPHSGIAPPYIPVVRRAEALSLLEALGCSFSRRRPVNFLEASESVNWATRALAVYRDAVSSGLKPSLKTLDRVLACLRWQHKGEPPQEDGAMISPPSFLPPNPYSPLLSTQQGRGRAKYELPFDKRAFAIMEEGISLDSLPPFTGDGPETLDLRHFRPTLAEVYIHYIFNTLEKRGAASNLRALFYPITLLLPPWDPNMVMWPSYVEKLNRWDPSAATPVQRMTEKKEVEETAGELEEETAGEQEEETAGEQEEGEEPGYEEPFYEDETDTPSDSDMLLAASSNGTADVRHASVNGAGMGNGTTSGEPSASSTNGTSRRSGRRREDDMRPETGLAVAAALKRLRLNHVKADSSAGVIMLEARDIAEWVMQKARYEQQQRKAEEAEALSALSYPPSVKGLYEQRRGIRMGMGPGMKLSKPTQL